MAADIAARPARSLSLSNPAWRSWAGGLLAVGLAAVTLLQLSESSSQALAMVQRFSPALWGVFVLLYLVQPLADLVIFRRLWRLPLAGLGVMMRKVVINETLFGYGGELYFYIWARRRRELSEAPFGTIKDVNVISALTANVLTSMEHVKSVPDGLVWHTDRADAQNLQELKVLETQSHPCDRDYAHTDFQACFSAIPAVLADRAASPAEEAEPVLAARTWKLDKGTWHARFCSLQGGERDDQTGFLSPYPGALRTAARDIKRCYKLGLCPSTTFHVRGRQVEVRRVRVHVHDAEETTNVKAKDEVREYCGLDAQRCWAMGHLLGRDCAEVDEERSACRGAEGGAITLWAR